jgi:hypothetical protein
MFAFRPSLIRSIFLLVCSQSALADDFTPLFNGKDLAGWVNVNCAPGTFYVKNNEIITTGSPTGYLRTEKQYENFVMEFEWMHIREKGMANSGLFVWGDPLPAVGTGYTRGIEVQVLINYETDWATSHGDLFSIWGAKCKPDRPHPKGYERCLPSEKRVKGAGQWNHYKVIGNNGVLKLEVNGKEVSGVSECSPRKGYLALESEGAECHFRNLKIKELPTTNPKPEEIAKVWEGHVSLFDGLTLKGFHTEEGSWVANDGILRHKKQNGLKLETALKKGELIFDWKVPGKGEVKYHFQAAIGRVAGPTQTGTAGQWNRAIVDVDDGVNPTWPWMEGLELRNIFFKKAAK